MQEVRIGRYTVHKELGRGGMGVVYLGKDPFLGRDLAIKVLQTRRVKDDMIERFHREARAVALLDHANIIKIYDAGIHEDGKEKLYYIVMEYVDGQTLGDLIESSGCKEQEALSLYLDLFQQVLQGVGYAHSKGVVHRDIKPENIMVTHDGVVKLMDFGLAFFSGSHSLTRADQIMGTVAYFSPEQAKATAVVDHRADIYSLGVIFYEMMTGQLPFDAQHPMDMLRKLLQEPPRKMLKLNEMIPGVLEPFTLKFLEKDPAHRYQNISEIQYQLRQFLEAPLQIGGGQGVGGSQGMEDSQGFEELASPLVSALTEEKDDQKPAPRQETILSSELNASKKPEATASPEAIAKPEKVHPTMLETSEDLSAPPVPLSDSSMRESSLEADFGLREREASSSPYVVPPRSSSKGTPYLASPDWLEEAQQPSSAIKAEEDELYHVKAQGMDTPVLERSVHPKEPRLICPECAADNPASRSSCIECEAVLQAHYVVVERKGEEHLDMARKAFRQGRYEESLRECDRAVSLQPELVEALLLKARILRFQQKFELSEDLLELVLEREPRNLHAYLALADLYHQIGQDTDAKESLREVLRIAPGMESVRMRFGVHKLLAQDSSGAVKEFKALASSGKRATAHVALLHMGMIYALRKRYSEASHFVEQALERDEQSAVGWFLLGNLYMLQGFFADAQSSLLKASHLMPDETYCRMAQAATLKEQGLYAQSEKLYSEVLALEPHNLKAHLSLSDIALMLGDRTKAERHLRQMLLTYPNHMEVHQKLGELAQIRQDYLMAVEHYSKVIEEQPEAIAYKKKLESLSLSEGLRELSLVEAQKRVAQSPVDPQVRELLAFALYRQKDLDGAVREYHKAATLDGKNAGYYQSLGLLYHQLGYFDEAVRSFQWSLHLDKNQSDTYVMLGLTLIEQGLSNMAVNELQKALEKVASKKLVYLYLAKASAAAGKRELAAESFAKVVPTKDENEEQWVWSKVYQLIARGLFEEGQSAATSELLELAQGFNPNEPAIYLAQIRVAISWGDLAEASSLLEVLEKHAPQSLQYYQAQAELAGESGNWNQAVTMLSQVLKKNPNIPSTYEELGRSLRKAERHEEALKIFGEAAAKFPEYKGKFFWLRGRHLARLGRWEKAIQSLLFAQSKYPSSARLCEDLARSYQKIGDRRRAQEQLHLAIRLSEPERQRQLEKWLQEL